MRKQFPFIPSRTWKKKKTKLFFDKPKKEQITAEVYKIYFKERLGNKRIKRFDNSKGR